MFKTINLFCRNRQIECFFRKMQFFMKITRKHRKCENRKFFTSLMCIISSSRFKNKFKFNFYLAKTAPLLFLQLKNCTASERQFSYFLSATTTFIDALGAVRLQHEHKQHIVCTHIGVGWKKREDAVRKICRNFRRRAARNHFFGSKKGTGIKKSCACICTGSTLAEWNRFNWKFILFLPMSGERGGTLFRSMEHIWAPMLFFTLVGSFQFLSFGCSKSIDVGFFHTYYTPLTVSWEWWLRWLRFSTFCDFVSVLTHICMYVSGM